METFIRFILSPRFNLSLAIICLLCMFITNLIVTEESVLYKTCKKKTTPYIILLIGVTPGLNIYMSIILVTHTSTYSLHKILKYLVTRTEKIKENKNK